MAASVRGKGFSHVNSHFWKSAARARLPKEFRDKPCHVNVVLANNASAKRHFFNSVRAAVSYYYDVILHTGNRFGAGTDANVFMELYGEKGSSGEVHLPSKRGDLERGMVNKYKVASKDLGTLRKVNIRHDNTGLAPAWYLEKVTVKDHSGSRYVFDCGQWLLKRSSEDNLRAQLSLSEQNLDQLLSYKGKSIDYLKLDEKEHLGAVEEIVHDNLSSVLQGIIQSKSDPDTENDSDFENSGSHGQNLNDYFKDVPMLPAARLLVEAFGLIKGQIPATGPKGHLLKGDILKYIESNKLTRTKLTTAEEGKKKPPAKKKALAGSTEPPKVKTGAPTTMSTGTEYADRPLSQIEKANANWYLESKQTVPHFYTSAVCNMNNVIKICKELSQQGSQVSTTAFVMKAASAALKLIPGINVKRVNDTITVPENIDIAVTLNTSNTVNCGLLRNVDQAMLKDIEDSLEDLKSNSSEMVDTDSGSFAVTDLSSGGLSHFSEIIRPHHTCVLTVGSPKLSLSENDILLNLCTVTLSCDGRLINENTASQFLNTFKNFIESPNAYL